MDIIRLGHSSFKLKGKHATVVTDPFDSTVVGIKFPSLTADIVTISHQHPDHNNIDGVSEQPMVLTGPGEYEVHGIRIFGIQTYHDAQKGEQRGRNTLYVFEMEGMRIVHCGDLGHPLEDSHIELIDGADILMVPVGGQVTIGPQEAQTVMTALEPHITIPMHYKMTGMSEVAFSQLGTLQDFLHAIGKPDIVPQQKLTVSKDKLPAEHTIVVLE